MILAALLVTSIAYKLSATVIKGYYQSEASYASDKQATAFTIAIIGGIASVVLLVAAFVNLLDPGNWVGLFAPRAALVYDIYQKLTSHN